MIDFDLIIGVAPQTIHTAGALPGDPPIIKLGCDMDQLTRLIHTCDEVRPFFKRFKDVAEIYDKHTGDMIIHEVLHLVILELEGWNAAHALDWIDNEHQISGLL